MLKAVICDVGSSEKERGGYEEEDLFGLGPGDAVVDLLPEGEPIEFALGEVVGGAFDPVEDVEEELYVLCVCVCERGRGVG